MPRPPSTGAVTSPFGMRLHPISGGYRMHNGEDTVGSGNYSPVTGTVIFAGWDSSGAGFGNAVAVRQDGADVVWWMAHFASVSVSVGQRVSEGQYLGALGKTGAATGPHVHTERRVGGTSRPLSGTATNPRSYYTSSAGGGTSPLEPTTKRNTMTTVYWDGQNPTGGSAWWALGGDSPGTTANWIVTQNRDLAIKWSSVHGPIVDLGSHSNFKEFGKWYSEPLRIAGGVGGGSADISNLPTKDDLGQALTSTVALVNEHADSNRDQIIDAIPGSSGYDVNLSIDSVPGTATGTATPA